MWVNKELFQTVLDDNKSMTEQVAQERIGTARMSGQCKELREQKARDEMTIDWMRHRINALEKERQILLQRAAGIILPVPEIVPSKPHTLEAGYDSLPSFEDVGDVEAAKLGIAHTDAGELQFVPPFKPQPMSAVKTE